jgi:TATA-box binding protein (TBP) (component of TFIID and TFIIIB)
MLMEMNDINIALEPNFKPTPCCVTTMTIAGKLDATLVPINDILTKFKEANGTFENMQLMANRFYNQFTIKHDRISVKIFANGSVHTTGCRSATHFASTIDNVLCGIARLMDTSDTMTLVSARVLLINATFNASRHVPLRDLCKVLDTQDVRASYNTSEYPGVITKIAKPDGRDVTAIVFNSGNVMLFGAKEPADLTLAYRVVCRAIDTMLRDKENVPPSKKPSLTVTEAFLENYTIVNGYSSRVGFLCETFGSS